jgi:hypothetical protein
VELSYCTRHERLYDGVLHQWIPFLRGEVRLARTIYPQRDALHFREDVCDRCVGVSHGLLAHQSEALLAHVPPRLRHSAWQACEV